MSQNETAIKIMDIAERMARVGGYHAFSFREIAAEIGIKSASVHYHFANKETLGAAIADRYTQRFMAAIGAPDDATPDVMLNRYVQVYRGAQLEDELMCLCGMFGAEIRYLPASVAAKTRDFFRQNLAWLTAVYTRQGDDAHTAAKKAETLIATLEGAMILSHSMDDPEVFQNITQDLT